jgi:DNA-binding response OmpR family regulator
MARVLLAVNDESRSGLVAALEHDGHEVELVDSRNAAARGISGGYDILLLNTEQPEVDGIDICRRVHAARPRTPIIFVSAQRDAKAVVAGLDAGADDYITKPFVMAELIARVRTQLRHAVAVRSQTANAPADAEARQAHPRSREHPPPHTSRS